MNNNRLEEKMWYNISDNVRIMNVGNNTIKLDYLQSILTLDVVEYMRGMYFYEVLLPVIDDLKKGEDIRNDVFSSLSDADLQGLMQHHTEKEEFEICAKIKKEIDERASNG